MGTRRDGLVMHGAVVVVFGVGACATTSTDHLEADDGAPYPVHLVPSVSVPMREAVAKVEGLLPGTSVDAELEAHDDGTGEEHPVYGIGVLSYGGVLHEFVVSARTGEVLSFGMAARAEDWRDAAAFRSASGQSSRTLAEFVEMAAERSGGVPIGAEFGNVNGAVCEVDVVVEGSVVQLSFDGWTGVLLDRDDTDDDEEA